MTPCPHPSARGTHDGDTATLTCTTCEEVLAHFDGSDTYELEVNLMRETVSPLIFRSWTGRRWLNGQPYTGPVYLYLSMKEA
jgi:hypothetical protein